MKRVNLQFNTFLALASAASTFAISSPSFAAGPGASGFGIGGLVGYGNMSSSVSGSSSNNGANYGAEFTYHFDPSFSAGLEWTILPLTVATVSGYNYSTYMASFNYHLADLLNPLYFGVEVGILTATSPSLTVAGLTVPGSTTTNFAVGARAGYDFQIPTLGGLTVGPQVRFDVIPVSGTSGSSNYTLTYFSAQGQVKYWF